MMLSPLLGNLLYETGSNDQILLRAFPVLLTVLCLLAIAYRYYSAFLAAKVAALDDARTTPAHQFYDGQNYHPTNKWVLFGHHFAAISGAGPLIGPVLAIQYGYMPGLLWLVVGVCLAGAVQDMLVLAASVRRGGKSLAEIARTELGKPAAIVVSAAILFIVIIALAGLGFVVVKALGGEEVNFGPGTQIILPEKPHIAIEDHGHGKLIRIPPGSQIRYGATGQPVPRPESFVVDVPAGNDVEAKSGVITLPAGSKQLVPGSSWGTFTIACTIPIALFVGWYMYRLRKGKVLEASLIGAAGVLAATVAGNWIPGSPLERFFLLTKGETVMALTGYGFIASVLPVWLLLCPRDYLSSFLKIGTIALLVIGVFVANPVMHCPPINEVFKDGGPTFPWGGIFPFVFICIMCGAISGFHALVSSGTTPKMINQESDVRMIGYGAMLIEGLVGVMALIAAASLPPQLYYDINVDLRSVPKYQEQLDKLYQDPLIQAAPESVEHPNLAKVEVLVGNESLRGRTGGAVTLAVGMAQIFTDAFQRINLHIDGIMKYWYHFAIMFEALFILTTIDTGTRIARFLLQEALGKVWKPFERTDWLPGAVLATFVVTAGWGILVYTGSIDTIWPMFGIANQLLAVVALCLVTTLMINTGRARYAWITVTPMIFVVSTTMTAGAKMIPQFLRMAEPPPAGLGQPLRATLNTSLTIFVIVCVGALLLMAISRWLLVLRGVVPVQADTPIPSQERSARAENDAGGFESPDQ